MSEDVRYRMQHLGDIFVDALSCVVDSAKKCAESVALTYDIMDLKKKKRQQLNLIGMRIVQVKKAGLTDLNRDDALVKLITNVEKMERDIEFYEEKKRKTAPGCQTRTHYADGAS
jgi:hypothetical protein